MIIVYSKQGKRIEKGVVKTRSRIVVHSKQEKKFLKKETKGKGGFY
jgi:hypothetical protein